MVRMVNRAILKTLSQNNIERFARLGRYPKNNIARLGRYPKNNIARLGRYPKNF